MAAECEIDDCGVLAVGRCGGCGRAMCESHRVIWDGIPVNLCKPCEQKSAEEQRAEEARLGGTTWMASYRPSPWEKKEPGPSMAAEHMRLLNEQHAPPPPRVSPHEVQRREREHQRQMEAAFNELGARFVQWALRNGYEPAKYGKLGRGWRIGDLGMTEISSDPSIGEGYAHSRDHAAWFVLADGTVTTIADIGTRRLGAESGTQRFIEVVRANWGCDLDQELPVSQPTASKRDRPSRWPWSRPH